MKNVAFIMIVALVSGACIVGAQEGKVNFSGEWTLNADESEMGGGGGGRGGRGGRRGGAASKMVVEHKDDELVVVSYRTNRDGEEITTETTYTLDGKQVESETNYGTEVAEAKWSKDGKTITIFSERTISRGDMEFTIESTAVWSLEDGALVIDTERTTSRGDWTSKAVYDKK